MANPLLSTAPTACSSAYKLFHLTAPAHLHAVSPPLYHPHTPIHHSRVFIIPPTLMGIRSLPFWNHATSSTVSLLFFEIPPLILNFDNAPPISSSPQNFTAHHTSSSIIIITTALSARQISSAQPFPLSLIHIASLDLPLPHPLTFSLSLPPSPSHPLSSPSLNIFTWNQL